jgi:hypothetical protein
LTHLKLKGGRSVGELKKKAHIFAQRASSGAAGVKVLGGKSGLIALSTRSATPAPLPTQSPPDPCPSVEMRMRKLESVINRN